MSSILCAQKLKLISLLESSRMFKNVRVLQQMLLFAKEMGTIEDGEQKCFSIQD